ncbi:MAG: SPASM domain-containing protein [Clostridiales bacterium]|jgi:uncharacterized protein|nr:SPASM domain-containing protein [Clostridiales bacterium]
MSGICTCQFVVEADGGVYPCDFYVIDEWYLGNLTQSSFEDIRSCKTANRFIEVSKYIDPSCAECIWFNLCRGGCRRDRESFEESKPELNRLCGAYSEFLNMQETG